MNMLFSHTARGPWAQQLNPVQPGLQQTLSGVQSIPTAMDIVSATTMAGVIARVAYFL